MDRSIQDEDQAHMKTNANKHSKKKKKNKQTKQSNNPPHLTKRLHECYLFQIFVKFMLENKSIYLPLNKTYNNNTFIPVRSGES